MDDGSSGQNSQASQDNTDQVAKHYNELKEAGLGARLKSRIFYLRNFNNWIKSMLIGEYLTKLKEAPDYDGRISVLDLCSGKGGDLLKWGKGGIRRLVCADIASTSVDQCRERYNSQRQSTFKAEFIAADCTKVRLKDQYEDRNMTFNVVSCQFSFHYSFESQPQAEMMLRNACECLKVGGYFIGTTPNSYEILKRLRDESCDGTTFGNDVYSIKSRKDYKEDQPDLFGACYDFHLEGVVDCPEFLVYFPLLEEMAKKYGMQLEKVVPFAKYFDDNIENGRGLIGRMQALEPYPAEKDVELMGKVPEDYVAAEQRVNENESDQNDDRKTIGTLSQAEWEATTIYLVFAFKKVADVCPELTCSPSETDLGEQSGCSPAKKAKTATPETETPETTASTASNQPDG